MMKYLSKLILDKVKERNENKGELYLELDDESGLYIEYKRDIFTTLFNENQDILDIKIYAYNNSSEMYLISTIKGS